MNINQLFSLAHHSLNVAEMQRNRFLFEEQEFQQKKRLAQKHREFFLQQNGEELVELVLELYACEEIAMLLEFYIIVKQPLPSTAHSQHPPSCTCFRDLLQGIRDDPVLLQTIQSILGRGGE